MKKEYNIGLDIGTSSVGWAIVEKDTQKIIKKAGKALWGVRLMINRLVFFIILYRQKFLFFRYIYSFILFIVFMILRFL